VGPIGNGQHAAQGSPQQLDEALAAKPLTAEQAAEVEAVAPRGAVSGTRYPAAFMATLDSETR
jgi:hypothetical protein